MAFGAVDLNYRDYVEIDPRYYRPAEVDQLLGDPTKAMNKLNWQPTVSVGELASMMVENDLELAAREKTLVEAGHDISLCLGVR